MGQVTISSVPELVSFIQTCDLPYNSLKRVVCEYAGQYPIYLEKEDKQHLIEFVERFQSEIENGSELPIMAEV